jgi:hypothetical protein
MKNFEEWLIENHPESLDENWRQTMGALALAGASVFGNAANAANPISTPTGVVQKADANQQARLDAMKRLSTVHRFKQNWGSEFGPQQDQELFDAILKLRTEKDHDDFLTKIARDRENSFRSQMQGRYHPDKKVQQSEVKQINNSYNFQYMDYLKALATASKMNL